MRHLLRFSLVLVILGIVVGSAHAQTKKPNILVILSDDVGYGEYGFQGSKDIPTPNIDSIAKNGVRFTQGYVSGPYCSPTRAGLMTGRYQTRFGHEFNSQATNFGLPVTERTIADVLKSMGYATCCVGKWHLGFDAKTRPTVRGFDEFYGTLANTPFFVPKNFVDSRISTDVRSPESKNFYTTDAYGDRAVDWIEKNKGRPWFLYLPFNAQHAPLEATQKYLDRFAHIKDEKRRTFAAMMSAMDDAVGRILAKIRELGQEENTLIVFTSDNGGPTQQTTSSNGPLRGFKATTLEGGVRVPFCMQWKGVLPAGKDYTHPIIQLDILPTAVAAAGGKMEAAKKIDGVNLLPYLTGKIKEAPHQTLYWRFGKQWAIRHGDYKLVVSRIDGPEPRLFNLANDIGEAKDLMSAEPAKAAELKKLYDAWNKEQMDPLWPDPGTTKKAKKDKKGAKKAAAVPKPQLSSAPDVASALDDRDFLVHKDIPYYTGKDADAERNKLDLYLPTRAKNFPVLFYIHGGGWRQGDRMKTQPLGETFARQGIGFVTIGYRLSPAVRHPAHIEDVAKAFAWTTQNIAKHGGRSDAIFVSGHSAGGHLAALLATDESYLKAHKLSFANIKGVLPLSGPMRLAFNEKMKDAFGDAEDAFRLASPVSHIGNRHPPFLVLFAEKDPDTIRKSSAELSEMLTKAKIVSSVVDVKDRDHGSIIREIPKEGDPTAQAMLEFIRKHSQK